MSEPKTLEQIFDEIEAAGYDPAETLVNKYLREYPDYYCEIVWFAGQVAFHDQYKRKFNGMNDKEFLWWIHERLVKVHGENENADYMHRLRAIIIDMPAHCRTADDTRIDTNAAALRKGFG